MKKKLTAAVLVEAETSNWSYGQLVHFFARHFQQKGLSTITQKAIFSTIFATDSGQSTQQDGDPKFFEGVALVKETLLLIGFSINCDQSKRRLGLLFNVVLLGRQSINLLQIVGARARRGSTLLFLIS